VPLINYAKISKINFGQFFRSLVNNMNSRLFTFHASNIATSENTLKNKYENLLKDMEVLEPKS